MAGARGCDSVIAATLQRGSDAKTESVCDPRLVRRSPSNSSKKLRGAILDKTGTSAAGRSFAAGEGKGRADLPADRESKRAPAERGAEPAHSRKCGGASSTSARGRVAEERVPGAAHVAPTPTSTAAFF